VPPRLASQEPLERLGSHVGGLAAAERRQRALEASVRVLDGLRCRHVLREETIGELGEGERRPVMVALRDPVEFPR
jgi:hypothetical protein